jgi:serine/threonine-protein kinase SIK3
LNRDSATFDIRRKKEFQKKPFSKANTASNFTNQNSYSIEHDNRQTGSVTQNSQKRKDSMNIYDIHRDQKVHRPSSKMKVFDRNGKIYMVSRTVLTEEDPRNSQDQDLKGSVTSLQINSQKLDNLELYVDKKDRMNFKMSGFLRDHLKHTSNYELDQSNHKEIETSELDSFAKECIQEEELINQKKKKKMKMKAKKGHKRSKTGVITRNIIERKPDRENLGTLLLSDENLKEEIKKRNQVIINNKKKGKIKHFEILEDEIEDKEVERMVFTNQKNVKGKVFDLFDDYDEKSNKMSEKSVEKRVNVSKKYDSGTNFFIQHKGQGQNKVIKNFELIIPEHDIQSSETFEKKIQIDNEIFSGQMSEKELGIKDSNLYQKSSNEVDSERNLLYHRFNASELKKNNRPNEKQGWVESQIKIKKEKIELGGKGSYSVRMMEDLKNFNKNLKKNDHEKRKIEDKKRRMQLKKKRDLNNKIKKKRGHKRNVHSEQLNDYFRDIVKKNNYPIEVKQTHQNMTPDISRNNSLNQSMDEANIKESREQKIEKSIQQTEDSNTNPFQNGETSQSKHIQISYENIRSSSQLTNVKQIITPKNHQLKSSFNFEQSQQEEVQIKKSQTNKTIDKKIRRNTKDKVNSFTNLIQHDLEKKGKEKNIKVNIDQLSNVESVASDSSSSESKIVELKRRRKMKKIKQKLINSKSVFLEDKDQNKYGSNRVKPRKINFMDPEDESDMQFIKHKYSDKADLDNFEKKNKEQIKIFNESHAQLTPKKSLNSDIRILSRASRKRDSDGKSQGRKDSLPMQTQEIIPQKRDVNIPKHMPSGSNLRVKHETRNSSNNGSLGNPSFAQGSRNSKISITITHKSSKNSEINNNIIISHSLQNSGIHSKNLSNQNIFKIESPDINSNQLSPSREIEIELTENAQAYPIEKNLDDLRTMNKKNMTFNPNEQGDAQILKNNLPSKEACLDVAIPQIRSSFEDSMASYQSEEYVKNPSEQQITENTFGYGMEAVIKQVTPKNVFADSLSSFGPKSKNTPKNKAYNIDYSDPKSVSQNSLNVSKKNKQISNNNHTEFYYEREHIGNGDSSYKFSNSDNSSRLKNITPTSNSRDALRSSNNESIEIGSRRRSKFMRDVLRGKLNSPVRKIRELSEEKEQIKPKKSQPTERNDNKMKVVDSKGSKNLRNSELVSMKKKHNRRKRTQLYDNKSAMMMLERSKKISQHNSPVRKVISRRGTNESKRQGKKTVRSKKSSVSKLYKQKKQVLVMKSRGNKAGRKHLDFVNVSHEGSTIEDKKRSSKNSRSRRRGTLSRETSKQNSITRQSQKKQSTVDKKKYSRKNQTKGKKNLKKKREKSKKDSYKMDSKMKGSRKNSTQIKESRKDKAGKKNSSKNKQKQTGKKKKHGSLLDSKQMKRVLEMKIMKYSTLGKVIETSLEFYNLKRMLGEGSYAKVHLGVSALCNKKVAIKLYEKAKIKTRSSSERIFTEIGILRRMNHRNIVNFIEIFQNPKYIFIVLEYANGGDLLNYLKTKGKFKEHEYRKILQQIIDALEYIHEHKILHRDIKLDNVLLTKSGLVKICDFGISRKMNRNDLVFEHIGTPAYIAPEIVKEKGYNGFGADIWSLGVMTYMALTGNVPFKGNTIEELHQSILKKEVVFSDKVNLSSAMKKAIKGMLIKDPRRRMTLKEICKILDLRPTLNQKKEKDYADDEIVSEIKSYGYPESMIKESLKNDMINHITALYKLLKN